MLADGTKDNWGYLTELVNNFPRLRLLEILDFFHAADQLHKALEVDYGEASPQCAAQFEKLRHILREDDEGVEKECSRNSRRSSRFQPLYRAR